MHQFSVCRDHQYQLGLEQFLYVVAEDERGNHIESKLFLFVQRMEFDRNESFGQETSVQRVQERLDNL